MAVANGTSSAAEPALKDISKAPPKGGKPDSAPKKPRVKRPNFNEIHAKPLPLDVYPLPTFIPHNPISIVRIAINLLSNSIWPPNSHSVIHKAYFSPETQSIHVTDPKSIRALWEQGFWGAGSLSRSDPRWLDQEKRRRGLDAAATSEEFTRGRREERRQMKLRREMAQRDAIEEQRRKELMAGSIKAHHDAVEQQFRDEGILDPEAKIEDLIDQGSVSESPRGTLYPADAAVPLAVDTTGLEGSIMDELQIIAEKAPNVDVEIKDQEHLQLTLEEAFFLSYVLGILDIYIDDAPVPYSELLRLFCDHSEYSPEQELLPRNPIAPDNNFFLNYVVFHHFRSLGWVPRPGIKFACDWLLYLRGPAFHHAEFAVMIVPSYSDPYWSQTPELEEYSKKKANKDWWWFHRLNRVQSQAHKTLMLVYVEVPPPWHDDEHKGKMDIGAALKKYKVRETIWKRWSPNRNRD